jgi:Ran GTPase-activating protein (RanGAP) involved in mRNA processing and transport
VYIEEVRCLFRTFRRLPATSEVYRLIFEGVKRRRRRRGGDTKEEEVEKEEDEEEEEENTAFLLVRSQLRLICQVIL